MGAKKDKEVKSHSELNIRLVNEINGLNYALVRDKQINFL